MDHFCYLCSLFVMLSCLFFAAFWLPVDKGLTFWLSFAMFNCVFVTFPCGILGQVCDRLYRFLVLATCTHFVTCYYGLGLKPPFELNIFVLHQQQNLERIFDTSKMHLRPPPPLAKAAVRSK